VNKIRILSQLEDFLDREFSWRLQEIADLRFFARSSARLRRNTIVRAGVPLLYAHWEGFVKNASLAYLNFVSNQRLRYDQLASCFIVFGLKKKLNQLSLSRRSHLNREIVDFLLAELSERAVLKMGDAIDTESNLSSSVFENIALSVGIDPEPFKTKYHLIDESLLER